MGRHIGQNFPLPFGEPARQPQRGLSGVSHAALTIAVGGRFCYGYHDGRESRHRLWCVEALLFGKALATEWHGFT